MFTRKEKTAIRTAITIGAIIWVLFVMMWMQSCKILTGYPNRALMTMESKAETIGIDPKRGIVYVMFRCKEPPSKMECGMMVQLNLSDYGETYLGEVREIKK